MHRFVPAACLGFILLLPGATYAAESDALAIDANIQARHLPFGTILDPIFASPTTDQIVGYTRCGDSAIWTGHYLAAEAFRYKMTQSPDALNNVKAAVSGIQSLVNVTGTDVLARCLVPLNSPFAAGIRSEEARNGIFTNTAGYFWVGNTSRDQYSGVFFGLAVAYDMVDDAAVQSSISLLVTRMLNFLVQLSWNVVMPDGSVSTTFLIRPDQMLTLMQIGQHVNAAQFAASYAQMRGNLQGLVSLPMIVDTGSDDSYFKFNLDYINWYNLIRLENSPSAATYLAAYNILRAYTAADQNAFFDLIDRALNGANAARDNEILATLSEWLARSPRDVTVNLNSVAAACGSQACQPIPVPMRPPDEFLWELSPYQLAGGGEGIIEGAGIDYILPYWMSLYYGVAGDFAVQSSAANRFVVAPDSIASIYGPNLASGTSAAAGQPLPFSLGGVSLTVTDAAGVQQPALLLYVSPGQINFVMPGSVAPGAATFTLNNGAATPLTAVAEVQNVAPTLFTMSSTGEGVPAATAIQLPDGGTQSPVPVFQCGASGCTAVPINLGVDTPVYLSLYGTGIRHRDSLNNVTVTINGVGVPVLYAGPQPQFAGLDQINVPLTLNLRGSGAANITVTVDGQAANIVTIDIQ